MGLFTEGLRRSSGRTVREEDIRKSEWEVKISTTEKCYCLDRVFLTDNQQHLYRFHRIHICLRDDEMKDGSYRYWKPGILTCKGDTGKKTVEKIIQEVLDENGGYFPAYDRDENGKCIAPKKMKQIIYKVFDKIHEYNLHMLYENK